MKLFSNTINTLKATGIFLLGVACAFVMGVFTTPSTGFEGRTTLYKYGISAVVAIFIAAVIGRRLVRLTAHSFVSGLIVVEIILYLTIVFFSGLSIGEIDGFTFNWFLGLSVFIAPPWLAGLFVPLPRED